MVSKLISQIMITDLAKNLTTSNLTITTTKTTTTSVSRILTVENDEVHELV